MVGVTPKDMQNYLALDDDVDTSVLQDMIDEAESGIMSDIGLDVDAEKYRKYKQFNQAVKTMVDFNYFNRGNLAEMKLAYPPSYLLMINRLRWKIRRDDNEDGG
ncbi:head-tail connector protein [Lactiplantibacillus paraxiangfangensis]|uniref:head-tail connector protein n=1 Tax=Lactiplantibacillus paraxiangfangensis TaxID=3076224 RepID=UPI0030C7395F